MVSIMEAVSVSAEIEASCAICGKASVPGEAECPHESERLTLALDQAEARWAARQRIRDWVIQQSTGQVVRTFHTLREQRWRTFIAYLQSLPCYTLYIRYNGTPPIAPQQLHQLRMQIHTAEGAFRAGVDEDWRRSCFEYPKILDYYFSLVEVGFPNVEDPAIADPRFGGPVREPKKVKARRDSMDAESTKEHRKGHRRRGTPPPAPMPGHRH